MSGDDMSKKYYNQIKEILKGKDLPALPSYNSFDWPKLKVAYEYVLVPLGLSLETWARLFKNKCNGLWYSSIWEDDLFKGSNWQLWQVYAGNKPQITNVSYNETDKTKLASAQVFLAQQWLRLELGKKPVDIETWTMASEVALQGVASVDWSPDDRQVDLYYWDADSQDDSFGVRGAESGQSLVLEPSSEISSLPSAMELQKNTEADFEKKLTEERRSNAEMDADPLQCMHWCGDSADGDGGPDYCYGVNCPAGYRGNEC